MEEYATTNGETAADGYAKCFNGNELAVTSFALAVNCQLPILLQSEVFTLENFRTILYRGRILVYEDDGIESLSSTSVEEEGSWVQVTSAYEYAYCDGHIYQSPPQSAICGSV